MTPSPELRSALAAAEQSLVAPHHDLSLAHRHAIWKELGPRDPKSGELAEGHRRRARLAILTAEKVLPFWEQWRPQDRRPRQLLALAETYLLTGRAAPIEDDDLNDFDVALEELLETNPGPAVMAAFAAVDGYRISIDDQNFDPDVVPDETEYDEPDVAFDAAVAYAGGSPRTLASDPGRRREFWLWWLREAVPTAAREPPARGVGDDSRSS